MSVVDILMSKVLFQMSWNSRPIILGYSELLLLKITQIDQIETLL